MNLKCILITSLQERHAKGVAQPVARFANANRHGGTVRVGSGDHFETPSGGASVTNSRPAIAAVTMRWDVIAAQHAIGIVVKLGWSVRLAELAGFSF